MNRENDSNIKIEQDIDSALNAALKLLSEAAPPVAMVSRIHRSLETSVITSRRARSGGRFWVPVACTMAATVLFVVFSHARWARRDQTSAAAPATIAEVTTPMPLGHAAAQPALVPAGNLRERFSQRADVRRSRREHPQYPHAANLLSYPLTRQEKLLVRFAQTAKPADLRDLDLEYQAKVEAQQEAEFAANMKVDNN